MAKIVGSVPPFIGTRDNVTIYLMNGEYIARTKSSLTGKRVKKDPAFVRTMEWAGRLKQASRIASGVYKRMPVDERAYKQYREITGKAMSLLKEGFDVKDVITMLETVYLSELVKNAEIVIKEMEQKPVQFEGREGLPHLVKNVKDIVGEIERQPLRFEGREGLPKQVRTVNSIVVRIEHKPIQFDGQEVSGRLRVKSKSKSKSRSKRGSNKDQIGSGANKEALQQFIDRPNAASGQVGIAGLSYLKYAEVTDRGLIEIPKLK